MEFRYELDKLKDLLIQPDRLQYEYFRKFLIETRGYDLFRRMQQIAFAELFGRID